MVRIDGSELLGLSGEVEAGDLHAVLDGRDPSTTEPLGRAPARVASPGSTRRSAHRNRCRSCSRLAAQRRRLQVRAAHDAAVAARTEVLEAETCVVRRGHAGAGAGPRRRVRSRCVQAPHVACRRPAPSHARACGQLGAFVRPMTVGRRSWSAGLPVVEDGRLPVQRRVAGAVDGATRGRLGPVAKGVADTWPRASAVHPRAVHSSARHRGRAGGYGGSGGRAAQVATYATRPKKTAVNMAELLPLWNAAANRHGLDTDGIDDLTSIHRRHRPALPDVDDLFARLAGPDGLTQKRSHFGRREVIEAIAAGMPEGARPSQVLDLADRFVLSADVVTLDRSRRIGECDIADEPRLAPVRWTTVDMLRTEQRLLQLGVRRSVDRRRTRVPASHRPGRSKRGRNCRTSSAGWSSRFARLAMPSTSWRVLPARARRWRLAPRSGLVRPRLRGHRCGAVGQSLPATG